MTEETTNLVKRRIWDVIQKSEVPEGAKIITGTWIFNESFFLMGISENSRPGYVSEEISIRGSLTCI